MTSGLLHWRNNLHSCGWLVVASRICEIGDEDDRNKSGENSEPCLFSKELGDINPNDELKNKSDDIDERDKEEDEPPHRAFGDLKHQDQIQDWYPGEPGIFRARALGDFHEREGNDDIDDDRKNHHEQKHACSEREHARGRFRRDIALIVIIVCWIHRSPPFVFVFMS